MAVLLARKFKRKTASPFQGKPFFTFAEHRRIQRVAVDIRPASPSAEFVAEGISKAAEAV